MRALVASSDGIAFVADGAVLPRRGGADDAPMEVTRGAVPFVSPASLRREFELPNRGTISGMLVPRGVTVIVGGGYHGEWKITAVGVFLLHLWGISTVKSTHLPPPATGTFAPVSFLFAATWYFYQWLCACFLSSWRDAGDCTV